MARLNCFKQSLLDNFELYNRAFLTSSELVMAEGQRPDGHPMCGVWPKAALASKVWPGRMVSEV